MTPTNEAERRLFDEQDVWLEMTNGPHGAFVNALGQAALRADPMNRERIKATWPALFDACEKIVKSKAMDAPIPFPPEELGGGG